MNTVMLTRLIVPDTLKHKKLNMRVYRYLRVCVKLLFLNAQLSFTIGIFELARGINGGICFSLFFIWTYPVMLLNCIAGECQV